MVYKLVEVKGKAKIKISEDWVKTLIPGRKKVFWVFKDDNPVFDIMLNEEEKDL